MIGGANKIKFSTILSPIRLDGEVALTTFQVGATVDKLLSYLNDVWIPTLHRCAIVVMDNLMVHHIQAVGESLCSAGLRCFLYTHIARILIRLKIHGQKRRLFGEVVETPC